MSHISLVLLGAGLTYVGVLLGIARERARKPKPAKDPDPVCGCNHNLAMHDPANGQCHERVEVTTYEDFRSRNWKWVTCPCRQYVGPQPLPHPGGAVDHR